MQKKKNKFLYSKKIIVITAVIFSILITGFLYQFNFANEIEIVVMDGLSDIYISIYPLEVFLISLAVFIFISQVICQILNKFKSFFNNVSTLVISVAILFYFSTTLDLLISNPWWIEFASETYFFKPSGFLKIILFILQILILLNIIITILFIGKKGRVQS